MLLAQGLRGLLPTAASHGVAAAGVACSSRAMATAGPSKKDVVHFLPAQAHDAEVDANVRAHQRAAFADSAKAPPAQEEQYELASAVERKYIAAQIVEHGVQGVAVPLAWEKEGAASLKRYAAQLLSLGAKAGFEDPVVEVGKRVAAKAATSSSAKELVAALKPYTSADFHAHLMEALAAVEAETGESVSLDGASAGYKKFAGKVQKVAEAHKLPWNMLVQASKPGNQVAKEYASWLQSARVADTTVEISALQAEATTLLDKHLSKSSDQIKKEQAAALAALHKRIEANKGAAWAQQYKKDVEALAAYDAAVAADPVNGPKVASA